MPDIPDIDILATVEFRLKGKDRSKFVDNTGNGSDPPPAPCPDLGTDVVKDRDPGAFCVFGQTQVEFRGIDQNQGVGSHVAMQNIF